MRPPVRRRKSDSTGTRRTIVPAAAKSVDEIAVDNAPLRIELNRAHKRLLVTMPYEVWVLDPQTLSVVRTLEVPTAKPSACEDEDGTLYVGGGHFHRGTIQSASAEKLGSKMAGFVDQIACVRPGIVCGIGRQGEILWDAKAGKEIHRDKIKRAESLSMTTSPDGRALWGEDENRVYLLSPDHTSDYSQLRFPSSSKIDQPNEGIVRVGLTSHGKCLMAARDGGLAWTRSDLKLQGEAFPELPEADRWPLAVCGDEDWAYVLRPRGLLHRVRIGGAMQQEPITEIEAAHVQHPATAATVVHTKDGPRLILGGPKGSDLGRLWKCDPNELEWSPVASSRRVLVHFENNTPGDKPASRPAPNFTAKKHKVSGDPISGIRVDDVFAGSFPFLITKEMSHPEEQPTANMAEADVLENDTLLLPAMIRMSDGTARPALRLWPAGQDNLGDPLKGQWLTWGDRPTGWTVLDTPQIRQQGWSRQSVFPLSVAMPHPIPAVPGKREKLPTRWVDRQLFDAMVVECKKMMKVLW